MKRPASVSKPRLTEAQNKRVGQMTLPHLSWFVIKNLAHILCPSRWHNIIRAWGLSTAISNMCSHKNDSLHHRVTNYMVIFLILRFGSLEERHNKSYAFIYPRRNRVDRRSWLSKMHGSCISQNKGKLWFLDIFPEWRASCSQFTYSMQPVACHKVGNCILIIKW